MKGETVSYRQTQKEPFTRWTLYENLVIIISKFSYHNQHMFFLFYKTVPPQIWSQVNFKSTASYWRKQIKRCHSDLVSFYLLLTVPSASVVLSLKLALSTREATSCPQLEIQKREDILSLLVFTHQIHERNKENTIEDPFFNFVNLS